MKTSKCSCKGGKTDPNCPVCNAKGDINLDNFHKLNPEADPRRKTAAQFKLSAPGLWGGLQQATKDRILGAGKAALTSAAIPAAAAAVGAGLSAEPGQGMADAARAGLTAGALGGAAGAAHHFGMTGTSGLAQSYQRGVGGDIRNMGNAVRDQMGRPTVAHPTAPAAPSATPPAQKVGMYYEFGKTAALATFAL